MKEYKSYKNYYVESETYKNNAKIKDLKMLLKATRKELDDISSNINWRLNEALTNKQYELLKNKEYKRLKELLQKQLEKENKKLIEAKEKALKEYEQIKALKDLKEAIIEIEWSNSRGAYGYQAKASGRVWYKNGDFKTYETGFTGGCGYDKPSTAMSNLCNKLLKIIILKHDKKIINDNEKHYKFYACEPLYFQYGVGLSSYEKMFANLGYTIQPIYHKNENVTYIIKK